MPRSGSTNSFSTALTSAARKNANCGMDCCPMKRPRMFSLTSSSGGWTKENSINLELLKGMNCNFPFILMPFSVTASIIALQSSAGVLSLTDTTCRGLKQTSSKKMNKTFMYVHNSVCPRFAHSGVMDHKRYRFQTACENSAKRLSPEKMPTKGPLPVRPMVKEDVSRLKSAVTLSTMPVCELLKTCHPVRVGATSPSEKESNVNVHPCGAAASTCSCRTAHSSGVAHPYIHPCMWMVEHAAVFFTAKSIQLGQRCDCSLNS